jgi:ABC-type nickel/cobalt efflux system permease component RcnA
MILIEINTTGFPLFAGIIAAVVHVLTGPDHLAAVMPLAVENHNKSWKIGLGWGFGHITGMLLIGVLFILFKEVIPVEEISGHSELLVGFVLIFIGLWAFYKIFVNDKKHNHPHIHTGEKPYIHFHKHTHDDKGSHEHTHKAPGKSGTASAFAVGTLHGLAGISHFILFLPALGLSSVYQSVIYLGGFAAGTLIAMTAFALITGKIAERAELNHNSGLFTGIRLAAGTIAIIIGIYWIFAR